MIVLAIPLGMTAQDLAKFSVTANEPCIDAPVAVTLTGINFNTDDGPLMVYETTGGKEQLVPSQMEQGHSPVLWIMLNGITPRNSSRSFVLKRDGRALPDSAGKGVTIDYRDLVLHSDGQPVLAYHHAIAYPPDSVSGLYQRSGFIHPLRSPDGVVLTRIQPPDHYHHYGIWGPWTKTIIEGRSVDFWNLAEGQGTVRFAGFLSQLEGPVFSGFEALQQHVDFGARGSDQIAINEQLDVRLYNQDGDVYIIDYTTTLNTPLDSGILLAAYRYGGGIGYRATEKWHKDNCTVLTSEGKTRIDADGSNARWCIVEGESDTPSGRSGILFLSHPSNRMHPEPMRVWPLDANNGRGDMYFEFVPIRHNDWHLDQGTNYTLRYRMIVFDGTLDPQKAEQYWNSFANKLMVTFP